jgi:tetratricopeptide (TPR) repeat protein
LRGVRTQAGRSSGSRASLRRQDPQPTPAESIGFFFRRSRESLNLSQEQLAALTNGNPGRVSRAMISAVECGRHLPGLEVLLTLTQALHISPAEVLERLELSRADVETAGLTEEQLEVEAGQRFWEGNFRQAVACWDALLRRLEAELQPDPAARDRRIATIEVRRGTALRRCGATAAARAAVERAITLADGDADTQARAYVVLATLLVQLGRLPLARDASRRAIELADESGETKVQGWAWIVQGEVLHGVGDYRDGYRAFLQARRFVKAAGDEKHEIQIEGNLGSCLYGLGRYGHARRRYQRAVSLARRQDVPASEALWLVELGRVAFKQGRLDEAYDRAGAALKIAKPREHWVTTFRSEWLRHLVNQRQEPSDPDRHRVAYLRRLFVRIEEHRGIEEVQEFKRIYCSSREPEGETQ